MKNIALVGFMGTGKTTIARILAEKLGFECVDIDDLIEFTEGMKIVDIFGQKGEAYFRDVEKEVVRKAAAQAKKVIACGGGVVLNENNIINLKQNGFIVCLSASPEVILERTKNYPHRPLLNVEDKAGKIKEMLEFRQPYYATADYTVNTSDLTKEEVVDRILELVNSA
ncbi:MAG: shikimate kinase [Candidatus Omnitrophota bacterium]